MLLVSFKEFQHELSFKETKSLKWHSFIFRNLLTKNYCIFTSIYKLILLENKKESLHTESKRVKHMILILSRLALAKNG
jgi:hypothetical protein